MQNKFSLAATCVVSVCAMCVRVYEGVLTDCCVFLQAASICILANCVGRDDHSASLQIWLYHRGAAASSRAAR